MKKSLFFPLIFLTVFIAGCTPATASPPLEPDPVKPIRYLALGDSYTIGESVDEAERWPVQLAALLKDKGISTQIEIIARTGWTTAELWSAIRQENPPQAEYDLVSLLVGVNDQYRGGSVSQYRADFNFLLNKAIQYATGGNPKRVLVLSIPDWGVTPYAKRDSRPAAKISAEIDAFNAVNQDEAQKAGVRYIDITPISREATKDSALIAPDGLHPSGKMYAVWAALALPEAVAAIQ